jgi:hypothetical protein
MTFAFVLSLYSVGCGRQLTANEASGRYSAQGDWGKSELVLRSSGTFVQDLFPASGSPRHLEGQWKISGRSGLLVGQTVRFSPFLNMWSTNLGEQVPSAICEMGPGIQRGVSILVDNDAGTSYKKP